MYINSGQYPQSSFPEIQVQTHYQAEINRESPKEYEEATLKRNKTQSPHSLASESWYTPKCSIQAGVQHNLVDTKV